MYYDRLGRSLTSTPARPVSPALPSSPAPHATSSLLKSYLEAHRTIWHLESLRALHPEIVTYLESRYAAARGHGTVCVRALDGSYPDVDLETDDPRRVAEALLSREYRQALFEERISPSIERLSA